ncbi:hypothetical protein BH10PSE3_BH10PSE3_24160 [soil metagenome]
MSEETLNVLLGDEYDHALIARTWSLLIAMGGRRIDALGFVAGSQEVSIQIWDLDGVSLRFEAETYIGLSVEGPPALVADLVARLQLNEAP